MYDEIKNTILNNSEIENIFVHTSAWLILIVITFIIITVAAKLYKNGLKTLIKHSNMDSETQDKEIINSAEKSNSGIDGVTFLDYTSKIVLRTLGVLILVFVILSIIL